MQHFTDHIRAAIKLNLEHWSSYQVKMKSAGFTEEVKILNKVFSSLVLSERLTMLFSWYYDWKCPVAMSYSFVAIRPLPEPNCAADQTFFNIDQKKFIAELRAQLKIKNFIEIEKLLLSRQAILTNPRHNCMLRHIIESMLRSVWVYQNVNLSPKEKSLYWHYVKGHALFFSSANELDKKAFAIQKLGIPVLATELPPIPHSPNSSI